MLAFELAVYLGRASFRTYLLAPGVVVGCSEGKVRVLVQNTEERQHCRIPDNRHLQPVCASHETVPFGDPHESFVDGNHGSITGAETGDPSNHLVCLVVAEQVSKPSPLNKPLLTKLAWPEEW